jgi:hypothetical protein
MRWTLGLLCLTAACFGEATQPSNTSADGTTGDTPTTSTASTTDASTETSASATATTNGETDTSGPPMTESSGADTTAGDECPMGSVPNPPPPPGGWSLVFVSSPSAEPPGCPAMAERVAVGSFGIPANIDECECRCNEPFHELCNLGYTSAASCPANGGDQLIVSECDALPFDRMGYSGDGEGTTCAAQPVPPAAELVSVCAPQDLEGACIEQPVGLIGPCLFREGVPPQEGCPGDLELVDIGRVPECGNCSPCDTSAHCESAMFEIWGEDGCRDSLVAFNDQACHQTDVQGRSISAQPTVPLVCDDASLTYTELTVCCPM